MLIVWRAAATTWRRAAVGVRFKDGIKVDAA